MNLERCNFANMFNGNHSKIDCSDNSQVLNYLDKIKTFLNDYIYPSYSEFVLCGRKKFIFDEALNILNGYQNEDNPIYFVLGSLEEFISNDNTISSSDENYIENRNNNDEYIKKGYICSEEKEFIDVLINKIVRYIG